MEKGYNTFSFKGNISKLILYVTKIHRFHNHEHATYLFLTPKKGYVKYHINDSIIYPRKNIPSQFALSTTFCSRNLSNRYSLRPVLIARFRFFYQTTPGF
jgi:hypothetical protein